MKSFWTSVFAVAGLILAAHALEIGVMAKADHDKRADRALVLEERRWKHARAMCDAAWPIDSKLNHDELHEHYLKCMREYKL